MTRSIAVGVLVLSLVAIAVAYAIAFLPGEAPGWAPWLLLLGTVTSLLSVAALGAASGDGGIGRLGIAFGLTFILVAGGLAVLLLLPDPEPGSRLTLGLPVGAAVLVYGVGILPLLVIPLAYAWTFNELGFRPGELEAVRDRARAAMAESDGSATQARPSRSGGDRRPQGE